MILTFCPQYFSHLRASVPAFQAIMYKVFHVLKEGGYRLPEVSVNMQCSKKVCDVSEERLFAGAWIMSGIERHDSVLTWIRKGIRLSGKVSGKRYRGLLPVICDASDLIQVCAIYSTRQVLT